MRSRIVDLLGIKRGFNVASNFTDYFEIGALSHTKYFLKGKWLGSFSG
jgi:hypothetical protein